MDRHRELLEVAKVILFSEEDRVVDLLFRRIMAAVGAHRGFLVVREGETFVQRYELNFSRANVSPEERRFSRSLVRQALHHRELFYSSDLHEDHRVADQRSVLTLAPASVVVAPLTAGDEIYGGLYLERPVHLGLDDEVKSFLSEAAAMAAQSIRRSLQHASLVERNASLQRDLFARHNFEGIVTRDPALLSLLETVAQVADSGASVLIRGETGTGKELIARALHANSSRRDRPFVTVHAAALSSTVLESELFGHVKGAFTGADRDRPGRLASAHRSTVFLDEVAELSPEVQAKLLRFLQFGELQRVGSDRVEKVDVRVVAATHQDLDALVRAGRFRRDLLYRLNVIELALPPLRERRGDVPLLLAHFLATHWKRKDEKPRVSERSQQALAALPFPGNVRELEHLVERACLLAKSDEVELVSPAQAGAAPPAVEGELTGEWLNRARATAVEDLEARFVTELLRRHDGNVSRAARAAGMQRSYLQKLMRRHQ